MNSYKIHSEVHDECLQAHQVLTSTNLRKTTQALSFILYFKASIIHNLFNLFLCLDVIGVVFRNMFDASEKKKKKKFSNVEVI